MTRETIHQADTEVVLQNTTEPFENPKNRLTLLARVGLAAGVLALAAAAATVRPNTSLASVGNVNTHRASHPMGNVGATSNQLWVTNFQAANLAARQIAEAGGKTVRIFEPDNPGQAEINNDWQRLCNAAEAARENNLMLEISFIGFQKHYDKKLKKMVKTHDYVPSSAHAVTKFLTTVDTILWNIAGPNANQLRANGTQCVTEPLKNVIVEEFDEVNNPAFNSNTDAAKKYAYLVSRGAVALRSDQYKINQALELSSDPAINSPFTLKIAIGALAAGHHDPVGFLRDFDAALKELGVASPPFDMLAVHPYPAKPGTNPALVEKALYGPIEKELKATYGAEQPIFYDEIGVPAIPAPNKRSLYGSKSLSAAIVSEGLQAKYYRDAFKEAAHEPNVIGELIFQSQDESNDGWPSGIYNPDGTHKSSWDTVSITFHGAVNGTLDN